MLDYSIDGLQMLPDAVSLPSNIATPPAADLLAGVGGGPWFCLFLGGVLENGARKVGSASVLPSSGFEKALLPKSVELPRFFDDEGDLPLKISNPEEELSPNTDPSACSSFLNSGASLKKLSPPPGCLESSPPELLKKLAMVLQSETSRGGLSLFFLTMRFSVRSFSIFNDAFFNVIF